MNPIFNALSENTNPMRMLAQLKSNPLGVLRQRGFNVPDNLDSPQSIIQHLMNSGQISQQQVNQAQMMAHKLGIK